MPVRVDGGDRGERRERRPHRAFTRLLGYRVHGRGVLVGDGAEHRVEGGNGPDRVDARHDYLRPGRRGFVHSCHEPVELLLPGVERCQACRVVHPEHDHDDVVAPELHGENCLQSTGNADVRIGGEVDTRPSPGGRRKRPRERARKREVVGPDAPANRRARAENQGAQTVSSRSVPPPWTGRAGDVPEGSINARTPDAHGRAEGEILKFGEQAPRCATDAGAGFFVVHETPQSHQSRRPVTSSRPYQRLSGFPNRRGCWPGGRRRSPRRRVRVPAGST